MKKYLLILLVLFVIVPDIFAASIQDMQQAVIAKKNATAGGEEVFINTNGLETQAEDDEWTTTANTPDYDYSAAPLTGLESLELNPADDCYITITEADDVYVSMQLKIDGALENDEVTIYIRDSGNNTMAQLIIRGPEGVPYVAADGGDVSSNASVEIDDGSVHYIMLRYQVGTGTNARIDYWHWNGSAWADNVSSTNGTATNQPARVKFDNNADTENFYWDQFKEKATAIIDPT